MDPWRRAIAFIRAVDERGAEQVVPFQWGRALINRRLKLVHDLNFLIVDRVADADARVLAAEADRIQGGAGLWHRRVNVDDQAAADRLAPSFSAAGYKAERFVVMVHRRAPGRQVDTSGVREVDWSQLRPARELELRQQPWAAAPGLVAQILAKHELTASRINTRYFGALVDGNVVSSCELRTEGDVAQIETVETLEAFRRRGLSRAVVSAALEAASAYDFVFLVADANDWPQDFYRRLGFDQVGIESRFLRLPDG
ncbi:MAG TPA: GNAT family N-acetyltransferase [Candidatus Dormibacteraeota bacterium]|nr:GNAT family N-acetyltransferase [Candidatus Dormibacteraeota bacterium]